MASSYSLGQHYESFVAELVQSGRYASASEVLRDGLRLLEEREDQRKAKLVALRADIQNGRDSGPPVPADEVFAALRQRYAPPDGA